MYILCDLRKMNFYLGVSSIFYLNALDETNWKRQPPYLLKMMLVFPRITITCRCMLYLHIMFMLPQLAFTDIIKYLNIKRIHLTTLCFLFFCHRLNTYTHSYNYLVWIIRKGFMWKSSFFRYFDCFHCRYCSITHSLKRYIKRKHLRYIVIMIWLLSAITLTPVIPANV